jgi:hypothetical protein
MESDMHLILYTDSTINIDLAKLSKGISDRSQGIKCNIGRSKFIVATDRIKYPATYSSIPEKFYESNKKADLTICFTTVQYDNNYFFQYSGDTAIVSFFAWDRLTTLPMSNGILYFVLMLLSRKLRLGASHKRITGCINDFNADKTAIDIGMRSAFLCPDCTKLVTSRKAQTPREKNIFKTLKLLLNDLSAASRDNIDIIKYWSSERSSTSFDVFLCHNAEDKKVVRRLNEQLKDADIKPWLDEEQLQPGLPWQTELEKVICSIGAAAVIVGSSNIGPWQNAELRAFLSEFAKRKCPVIPVLLPGVKSPPDLPVFLNQMTWVDLRSNAKKGFASLIWGITGDNTRFNRKRNGKKRRR